MASSATNVYYLKLDIEAATYYYYDFTTSQLLLTTTTAATTDQSIICKLPCNNILPICLVIIIIIIGAEISNVCYVGVSITIWACVGNINV